MGQYKVIFLGLGVAGPEEEARLLKGLQKKFNLSPERAERLLQKVPVVVKKGESRGEMEKYVRAFQEIGGRIRLEEEEMMPELSDEAQIPEPERKPHVGRMMTCPQCGFEQPETEECVKCGLVISRYSAYQEMASIGPSPTQKASPREKEASWEGEEGFFSAFFKTAKSSLFAPKPFFWKNAMGEGYLAPLIYGLIVGIIGLGGSMFWQRFFPVQFFSINLFSALPGNLHLMILTIALPFVVLFFILLGSVVTHLCLLIVGGNKNGFRTTFRVVCYSNSGHLFGIIPVIGSTIGSFCTLILTIIGVREGHRISTSRAVLAVLFPLILLAGLGIIAAIFIPLFLGSMRFLGGVGI